MKGLALRLFIPVFSIVFAFSCQDSAPEGEVWPKNGYLFTRNYDLDTVYVAAEGTAVRTTYYSPKFPIDDNTKKWTIQLPTSGKGVLIHNGNGGYWSIDSAFHPGLNVKQRFIKISNLASPSDASPANRFIYHKGSNGTFYIESFKFPEYFVTGLPHAESGRGMLLRHQTNGSWDFWVEAN
jgi:hypothetical protein